MENKILSENIILKSKDNCFEIIDETAKELEKGSIENLLFECNNKRYHGNSPKELSRILDDKDEFEEKKLNCDAMSKECNDSGETDLKLTDDNQKAGNKNFNFETLNRDLTDIEERLRATRLSWNKNGKSMATESNETISGQKDVMRKSWSLLEIEKRPYSNGSSLNELDNCKRHSGEKYTSESPAFSDGLLKWDYGADIGLPQEDSDDMEPITWPVTAEQAQRDAQANELSAGRMGRKMKLSLSQGSFLSSPDPEDRHNLIAKISAEYKSNQNSHSLRNKNPASSTDIISLANGIYDDLSARQIMEQAEAAERRLRQRLEAVKALNYKDSSQSQYLDGGYQSPLGSENGLSNNVRSPVHSDSPGSREVSFDRNISNSNFLSEAIKDQPNKFSEDVVSDVRKHTYAEDECKSPTSVTNTGRTTTMESTHTSSDYCKAPVFTGEIYGSRKDTFSTDNNFVMYSKQNRDPLIDKLRSLDNREMRNPRLICGIAPELDTISSRETLQITDEKKDDFMIISPSNRKLNDNSNINNDILNAEDVAENLSDKDVSQEHSLQAKWNQFKTLMKNDEYNKLFEKTTIRSPVQYPLTKSVDQSNAHRQQSATTTFTTITNVSPRYDSFATDVCRNPPKDLHSFDRNPNNVKYGNEAHYKNKSNGGKGSGEKHSKVDNEKRESTHYPHSRSRSGKRLTGGGGGGGKDNDDDDEISQTERRKLRHAGELARFKKRFGSGPLDGETTASELEHDDLSKFKRNLMEKETRKKQLSYMLTEISKEGVAEDSGQDLTNVSQSSSVDTMVLMNKMSHLLKKKKSENLSKREFRKYSPTKSSKKQQVDPINRSPNRANSNRVVESNDAKLVLKHLMLKQKVKWLADCAREEARRRKIRKLEKLIDLYEQGNPVIIPDDLETETATLMGSDRGSLDDMCSQTDSCSFYEDEITNMGVNVAPTAALENYDTIKRQKSRSKSPSLRKHYVNSRPKEVLAKEESPSLIKKYIPPSEAWHIPLRDPHYPHRDDFNDSNEYQYESPNQYTNSRKYCRSSHDVSPDNSRRPTNLTVKERVQLRRELELARQRNAHECQKDIRHTKTGNTKVANGGLAWVVGLRDKEADTGAPFHSREEINRKNNLYCDENAKDRTKSELQIAFENRMGTFISKSRQRQKRIKLAVDERRYESQMNLERARLFVCNNESGGLKRRRPITQPDPLSADRAIGTPGGKVPSRNSISRSSSQNGRKSPNAENLYRPRRRRFSKSEMRIQSARKYQCLPEVQAKYLDEKRRARIQNNRMKMHLYGERILQSLLRNRGPWVSYRN